MKDEDEVVGQKERGGERFIQCNIHSLRWKQTKNKRILIIIRWLLQLYERKRKRRESLFYKVLVIA